MVGDGQASYVIAEVGVNHGGSVETALRLIDAAAEAGADAVKFQMFTASELVTPAAPTTTQQRAHGAAATQIEMLRRLELSQSDWLRAAAHGRECGLDIVVTPFSAADVDRLCELGAVAVKLASTDLGNAPLQTAAARSGLAVIVSTGAADEPEVDAAVHRLGRLGAVDRTILLHCVSSYPTRWADANLRAIAALRARFHRPCGFSDHTTDWQTGALAVAVGACVVEKHLTLDRRAPGPDHAMSLPPDDLKRYVQAMRHAELALGSGAIECIPAEEEVRRVARRSVVARASIPAGTVLSASMLTAKRPGGGLDPTAIERLVGRTLTRAITTDQPLTWEMVE